ncbi:hypothetical protein HU200_062237 [Digitaria exilis]|uniref:Uncharacterized protein n=1 Tax=Digitaria exilis TaxID=1010633 RepID=A0A835DXD3_9POAL|nr:hypothetical protein HU200_062237 [Digitaria exilis]
MAEIVGSVLVQEGLSKAVSFLLGKRQEKASEALNAERLEMAVSELEFALERTAKLPVTDVSLLHRRKMISRAYLEGTELLNKHRSSQQPLQEQGQQHKSQAKRKRWIIARALSVTSSAVLKTDDIRRFEWFADHARRFVRDVESGCSLRHYTFCSPHVRHLLEGTTLRYQELQGRSSRLLRRLCMQPVCLEGRGVEAVVTYKYRDCKMPVRSFNLVLILRLSESTDIVEIAIGCLRSMASQFQLVPDAAMGELTLLPNLEYISHPHTHAARCYDAEIDLESSYKDDSQYLRPDPTCCKHNGHGPCANGVFPEQVIHFFIRCSVSVLGCSLPSSSSDGPGKDWRAPLNLTMGCMPHHVYNEQRPKESYALEIFGDDEQRSDVSIQKGGETLRLKATDFFLRQPELTEYRVLWISKHGVVGFFLEKPGSNTPRLPKDKTSARLSSRMATACHRAMSLQQRSLPGKGTEDQGHGHACPFGPWAV